MIDGKDDGMKDYDRWLNDSAAYERYNSRFGETRDIVPTDAEDNKGAEKFYREKYGDE